jgi:hypothetical protein
VSGLALLAREDDLSGVIWFVLFFLFPLVARLVKWLGEKAKGSPAPAGEVGDAGEARRRLREERRQAEAEGEDLWKRLARGEEPEPRPEPKPVPVRPVPVPVPSPVLRSLEVEPSEVSLEEETEPAALSVMGDVSEPSEAPELSLEREEEPAPLASFAMSSEARAEPARPLARLRLGRDELRRAMLLNEVLGPPVAERPLRA